jgi:hypothetical protein
MICQREVLHDAACGEITVDHNPSSGAIFIEFERFETDDAIMPRYRVSLTTEHVAAWLERLLTECGRRCKRIGSCKRLPAMLKLTERDESLVYCTHAGPNVILVRNGRVLKVPFSLTASMADLYGVMREQRTEPGASVQGFVEFVRSLMT